MSTEGIKLFTKGKIFMRFRRINIALFSAAFIIMAVVMFFAYVGVTNQISVQYTQSYAVSSADALSSHLDKEITLISRAANSPAVIEWLQDDLDEEKRSRALELLHSIVGDLYSFNMYIGVESSLNEYSVSISIADTTEPIAVLSPDEPNDAWYFHTFNSNRRYELDVDIDDFMQRKRVWLNYKVEADGVVLGVISTGLEFSHVVNELFSHYDSNNMRGVIIDGAGTIIMDGSMLGDTTFLYEMHFMNIETEFPHPEVSNAINRIYMSHPGVTVSHWWDTIEPEVVDLAPGPYRYMTIVPIRYTDWSILTFSNATTLFDTSYFIPVMITVLVLLIAFAVLSSVINYRLMYKPLKDLESSLSQLNEHSSDSIYGLERDDELGNLSNTIHDLFTKANVDPLTCLYNRRFMDSSIESNMGLLSRTNGLLSVLMIDIDYFKRYNDTYGHEAGDECLRAVAHALSITVSRVNDIVVRYGGEEFVIILPNTDEAGACKFAEKVLENVQKMEIPHKKNEASEYVTVSVGAATGKVGHNQELAMFIKRADEALYKSKESGRNKYTFLEFK